MVGLGLWCLTIFQLYCDVNLIGGGNRSKMVVKLGLWCLTIFKLYIMAVSFIGGAIQSKMVATENIYFSIYIINNK